MTATLSPDERRALLARLIAERIEQADDVHPLSYNQQALWFIDRAGGDPAAYTVLWSALARRPIERSALHEALRAAVRRHPMLRATFFEHEGTPRQRVHRWIEPGFEVLPAHGLDDEALRTRCQAWARRPFDLSTGPLVRLAMFERADDCALVFTAHHIVVDGGALSRVFGELTADYARATGHPLPQAPEPAARYVDFVAWQRTHVERHAEAAIAHWRARLGDLPDPRLPDDGPWLAAAPGATDTLHFALDPSTHAALGRFAREVGASRNAVLLTAFGQTLGALCGRVPPIGVVAEGRTAPRFADVVGDFVNPVVIPPPSEEGTGARAIEETRVAILEALEHQDLPFAVVTEITGRREGGAGGALFRFLFVYQQLTRGRGFQEVFALDGPEHRVELPGLSLTPFRLRQQEGQFDLALEVVELAEHTAARIKYRADRIARRTVERIARRLGAVLDRLMAAPETPTVDLRGSLPADEAEVAAWNRRPFAVGAAPLTDRIAAHAARRPDHPALVFRGAVTPYGRLMRLADQLAHGLVARGVRRGDFVAVAMERSEELIIALLAILRAGAVYMPVDPDLPRRRVEHLLADAAPRLVLCHGAAADAIADGIADGIERWPITLEDWPARCHPSTPPPVEMRPSDPAYVIFTSGSTGRPKGVVNLHEGITNHVEWLADACPLDATDRTLQKTPHGFDVSVCEILWTLTQGATLVIAEPGGHRWPRYLSALIAEQRVTAVHVVPSQLRALVELGDGGWRRLRTIVSAGEALPLDLVERVHAESEAALFNLYGPTEAAVGVAWWDTRALRPGQRVVPIGRPWGNTRLYVVDEALRPVPIGVAGELLIVGRQVAPGYLARPELTAERFVDDALGTGERGYRSGDLCRFLPDGEIEYLGRLDHQVKLRGFRIELGEIDTTLRGLAGVRDAVTTVHGQGDVERRLVAYVACDAADFSADGIRAALALTLPEYMVPSLVVRLDALPQNASGKIDRGALPPPDFGLAVRRSTGDAPRTETQRAIGRIWCDLLGVDAVGVRIGFFEAGGHSLMLARLQHALRTRLGVELSLPDLLAHPSIERLADRIDGAPPEAAATTPTPRIGGATGFAARMRGARTGRARE